MSVRIHYILVVLLASNGRLSSSATADAEVTKMEYSGSSITSSVESLHLNRPSHLSNLQSQPPSSMPPLTLDFKPYIIPPKLPKADSKSPIPSPQKVPSPTTISSPTPQKTSPQSSTPPKSESSPNPETFQTLETPQKPETPHKSETSPKQIMQPGIASRSPTEPRSQSYPETLSTKSYSYTVPTMPSPATATISPGGNDLPKVTSLLFAILLAVTAILLVISGVCLMDLRRHYLDISNPSYNKLKSEPI